MARKKRASAASAETGVNPSATAVIDQEAPATEPAIERPAYIDGPPTTVTGQIDVSRRTAESGPRSEEEGQDHTHGKNWGPPYKAVFTSAAKGFEMGENRRFKQRVFKFKERPDEEIVATLKEHGFRYRPEEKAWTIPADAGTRLLTDRLAAQFAGESVERSR